jgi:hypothetical protein
MAVTFSREIMVMSLWTVMLSLHPPPQQEEAI